LFKVIALLKRKAGLSMEDFIDYYETHHAPLMARLQQPEMIGYRRNFVQLDGGIFSDGEHPWFDVITEFYFLDRAAYESCMARNAAPELTRLRVEDAEKCLDQSKIHFFFVEESATKFE